MRSDFEVFQNAVAAYNVRCQCFHCFEEIGASFDLGLRINVLGSEAHLGRLEQAMQKTRPGLLYRERDTFGCCYCAFHLPGRKGYCMLGPWLEEEPYGRFAAVVEANQVPGYSEASLLEYLQGLPVISDTSAWYNLLASLGAMLYGGMRLPFARLDSALDRRLRGDDYLPAGSETLEGEVVERRYREENALLLAVAKGNEEEALAVLVQLSRFDPFSHLRNDLFYVQNAQNILHTLLRKATELASVAPLHVDVLARGYGQQIYTASHAAELNTLGEEMVRSYCRLVQRYTLVGYSPLVRGAIAEIGKSLQAQHTLSGLAEKLNVNPSYLSAQFRRETGTTLTSYVHQRRLEVACSLLRNTSLPVYEVAERCGYADVGYFSRLFKREYGQSPRRFRALNPEVRLGLV